MKSKLTITIASILSVLVLVGVGFAAWVIINPNVGANADGNIEVDTVTDNSYDITAEFVKTTDTTNGTIVFGKEIPENYNRTVWLTNDNEKAEKLTATLTLTAQNFKAASWDTIKTKTLTVSMKTIKKTAETETDDTGFAGLVTGEKKYIKFPVITGTGITASKADATKWSEVTVEIPLKKFTHAENATTATYELTITFSWGAYFTDGGSIVNPYVFYNNKDYGTDNAALANADLTAIHSALKDVFYKVSIKEQAA